MSKGDRDREILGIQDAKRRVETFETFGEVLEVFITLKLHPTSKYIYNQKKQQQQQIETLSLKSFLSFFFFEEKIKVKKRERVQGGFGVARKVSKEVE